MDEMKDFEKFAEDTKLEIIRLEEESSGAAKKAWHAVSAELDKLFNEAKKVIVTTKDSEKTQEFIEKVKVTTVKVIDQTKDKANTIKEDDKVQEFVENTKTSINKFRDTLNENDTYKDVKSKVGDTANKIYTNENVQKGIKKGKKTLFNVTEKALTAIHNATKEEPESKDED